MPSSGVRACGYILKDDSKSWNYVLKPGQSQEFPLDRQWTILFDRGDGFGEQSYQLQSGNFEFHPTQRGWELFSNPAATTAATAPGAPPPPM
ncbi:MAG: hypothetical protein KDA75_17055 [Planctomycetaceae bacterium]|nr:hypothetical protein [Planctomycetaceae bacterium]